MLNRQLIGDSKDREIARLKLCIEKFKEYDEKRKEYIAQLMEIIKTLEGDNFQKGDIEKFRKYKTFENRCSKLEKKLIALTRDNDHLRLVINAKNK